MNHRRVNSLASAPSTASLFSINIAASTAYFTLNYDLWNTFPEIATLNEAMFEMQNEPVYSNERPYVDTDDFTEEEHNAMHSNRPNSDINYPHTFIQAPIHIDPSDDQSKIVGATGLGFAWDYALRYLLPDNVEGIIAQIQNSCNQSSLYELSGFDAFYLGINATKDSKYDDMMVARDLSSSSNPNYNSTSGHCRYTIVRGFIFIYSHDFGMMSSCATFRVCILQLSAVISVLDTANIS
jgi:hypothetical protein